MSVFDRFQPPSEDRPYVAECEWCRGEIRAGDEVKRIDDGGGFVHNGFGYDCATEYADVHTYDVMGPINQRGEVD